MLRITFWIIMKLLAGAGVALAVFGLLFYAVLVGVEGQRYAALNGITLMFFAIPLMAVPSVAFLFKRLR